VKQRESVVERVRALRGPVNALLGVFLAAGIVILPAPSADAQSSLPRFEVTQYAIAAELFPTTHMLAAKVQIEVVPKADTSSLLFELNSALKVKSVVDAAGKNLQYRQDGLNFQVEFLSPLPAAKPATITVDYDGTLATAEGSPVENLKLAYVGPEGSYLLYPARWFPVNGYGVDRFGAAIRVTVPTDETVIASGTSAAPQREPGKVTYSYRFDQRSFPGTVIAGNYVVQPSTAIGADIAIYLKKGHEQYAGSYGETAAKILEFYSLRFGPLPNRHLALAEIDDNTVNGYAAPGLIALASRGFAMPVNYRLLAHEFAHLWWRCLVSPAAPDDAFLDDGLATYAAAMDVQEMAGENAFEDVMHDIEVGALTHEEVSPISQAERLHEFTPEYDSIVYRKGAMVFHMLRWVIGDDAFFQTLQAVAKQHAWGSISTDEFQKLAEKIGKQQLTYFFAQWVTSTGVPQFKRTWAVYRTDKGYQVMGKVQQDLDIFRMPVEVRVYSESTRPITERVEMVGTTADFTINTRTRPTRVVVDPASRLLKYDDKIKIAVEMARGDQLSQEQAYLEAIKQYQSVLDLNKNYSLAHYRVGEILFKLRNYNAAMESFRQALNGDLDPKWIEVWSHLEIGKIFDVTGQRDRALNEYQRALQTNNNTQGALDEANRYIQKPYTAETVEASATAH